MNHQLEKTENSQFGFWVYLMTDLLMFSGLFATYAVLRNSTFGGPGGKELFDLRFVLVETLILLTSSFTCGLGYLAIHREDKISTLRWFGLTFALGLSFLGMEFSEFHKLIIDGNGPQKSAFLSSYFTLVGAHGTHIAIGLLWMAITLIYTLRRGLNEKLRNNLARLAIFWHFLDLVWIFIFTIVYLMGKS